MCGGAAGGKDDCEYESLILWFPPPLTPQHRFGGMRVKMKAEYGMTVFLVAGYGIKIFRWERDLLVLADGIRDAENCGCNK